MRIYLGEFRKRELRKLESEYEVVNTLFSMRGGIVFYVRRVPESRGECSGRAARSGVPVLENVRRRRQEPQEVMKEMRRLCNLFVKRQLDEHGFSPANRSVVLNFMVELC